MKKYSGLTLVELMVVLLVAAVLATLAIPSFRTLAMRRQLDGAISALMADFSFARSEALKRGHSVTICRWGAGAGPSATCATGKGSWHNGWLVFDDRNEDGTRSTTEPVLRFQGPSQGVSAIAAQNVTDTERFVRYRANGLAMGTANHFVVTVAASVPGGSRLLCLSNQGRVMLRPQGDQPPCN